MTRSRLTALALRTIRGAGYELIPRWRLPGFQLSQHLRRLFSHYDVNVVVDVGANRGQYRSFLRDEVGFEGRIESFEPIPDLAGELVRRSATDKQWAVHAIALGAQNGCSDINVMIADDFSSFLDPMDCLDDETYGAKNIVRHKVAVQVRRLDSMESELGLDDAKARIFLKMDTQGFDLEVFKGATGVLDRLVAIQSEVSVVPLYKRMPDMWSSMEFFRSNGFEVSGLFPVSRDSTLKVIEFDCVMVKDKTAPLRSKDRANAHQVAGDA